MPIDKWLHDAVGTLVQYREQGIKPEVLAALHLDEDVFRLSVILDDVRHLNLACYNSEIPMTGGGKYEDLLSSPQADRATDLRNTINQWDEICPSRRDEVLFKPTSAEATLLSNMYKADVSFHQTIVIVIKFKDRLQYLYDNSYQINFETEQIRALTYAFSDLRI